MTIETSHGNVRPTLPRSSDLPPVPEAEPAPSAQRDAQGRFTSGNAYAYGGKWRSLIADGLGRDVQLPAQLAPIAKRAYRLYRAFLRDLPCDSATVRSLVVERARAAALADWYAQWGVRVGPHSDKGLALLAESRAWGQRAERLAVTAMDISIRQAKAAGRDRPTPIIELIEARAQEYVAAGTFQLPGGEGPQS